jgi:hypothetical protein
MGLRPCERLGDLGRAGFSRNHSQIRNPHEHLKVRRDNVEVRRAMIVGVSAWRRSRRWVQGFAYRSGITPDHDKVSAGGGIRVFAPLFPIPQGAERYLKAPREFLL